LYFEEYAKNLIDDEMAKVVDGKKVTKARAEEIVLGKGGTMKNPTKGGLMFAYHKMNEGDGQGWVTFDSYRIMLSLEGVWTDQQEFYYQKIVNKEVVDPKTISTFFPVQKVQYYGPLKTDGLPITAFHKFSLFPLIPGTIKDTRLEQLHDKMVAEGIDYALFESGSKVGVISKSKESGPDALYSDDKTREISAEPFTRNTIHLNYLKNQLAIAPKWKKSATFSTQLRAIIEDGLMESGVPTDFMPGEKSLDKKRKAWAAIKDEDERKASDEASFSALAFKIATDPYVGRLTFARVYSGTLKSGSYVLNSTSKKKERVGRIVRMHANHREEVDEVYAGEIAAIVGLKYTTTGDTLCDEADPIILEKIEFPEPVIDIAIEPKTKADQEKLGIALKRLAEEDPTFRISSDEETSQTIISGMGELHLEIIVDRMKREFSVEANVGKPQVAYRETINGQAEAEGKFIRQSGGRGQYGHVWLKVEPLDQGSGFEFVDQIKGGDIPQEFIPAVEKGVKEAMKKGVVAGYPMVDMKITLYDGSYHEVDSSEVAFKIAASEALQKGSKLAKPVLLEPVMKLEVIVPAEFMGDVTGDLNSKRAQIENMSDRSEMKVIDAKVPLAEMFGYATNLRSITSGRGSFTMEFDHYAEVPRNITEEIKEGKRK
jgi:hypothetical protein